MYQVENTERCKLIDFPFLIHVAKFQSSHNLNFRLKKINFELKFYCEGCTNQFNMQKHCVAKYKIPAVSRAELGPLEHFLK
jgi:hypothetical protein